jgi:hypothetical protein
MECQTWWYMPIIPAIGRQRQEYCKFEARLGYHSKTLSQGLGNVAQRYSACLACARTWIQFSMLKEKKKNRKMQVSRHYHSCHYPTHGKYERKAWGKKWDGMKWLWDPEILRKSSEQCGLHMTDWVSRTQKRERTQNRSKQCGWPAGLSPLKKRRWRSTRVSFYQALVAHTCNPSYSGGSDQKDHCLKPAQANSSQNPIWKYSKQTRAGGAAQVAPPPRQAWSPELKPEYHKKKKNELLTTVPAATTRKQWNSKMLLIPTTLFLFSPTQCTITR